MAKRTTYAEGWELYPFSAAGHHVQGAIVMAAVLEGPPEAIVAGALWTGLYIAYQALSVLRKEDSPGLDIADFMAGAGVGIVGSVAAGWLM